MPTETSQQFTPQSDPCLADLRNRVVEGSTPESSYGRKNDLSEHLAMLEREFAGQPMLALFHAATIVFLRRGLNHAGCAKRFTRMWTQEADALLTMLDMRWLVSACDTFIDISEDPMVLRTAALGTGLVNIAKLYETERVAEGTTQIAPEDYDLSLVQGHYPLFDGISAFRAGSGEMPSKLLDRFDKVLRGNDPCTMIVRELIARLTKSDTVFKRFSQIHTRAETRW